MKARFPGALLVVLLSSLSLFAQPAREAVTIEVVDVPVFVTRDGVPVEGLTRDDFELYVNGKRQAIDYFDAVGIEGVEPQTIRDRRLFLLMFDLGFTPPHQLGRAQKAAAELILKSPATDVFAIATYSARRGVWFATPFTSDRVALGRGIASLSAPQSGDPLAIVLTGAERQAGDAWSFDAPEQSRAYMADNVVGHITGEVMRDIIHMQLTRAAEDQILSLQTLASRLAALQGQKHMVLLSYGWDNMAVASNGRLDQRVSSIPQSSMRPSGLHGFGATLLRHLRGMEESFQHADVRLHTLDLRGVASPMSSDALAAYALGTGGTYLHNSNDIGGLLVDLSESTRAGYTLGFRPVNAKRGHNKIEVKLRNRSRNTTVEYRKGFSGAPPDVDRNDGLYLADVVLNDVPQTGTAVSLSTDGAQLGVRVPLRPLSAQLGPGGKAELLVYVFGKDGVALDFHKLVIDVPAEATGEGAFELPLPAGAATVKALLRVEDSLGFSRMDL